MYWMSWFLLSLLFGLCIGSFTNVIIYRLPNKKSMLRSRSHCTHCDKLILWYENIPLLSYIFLRGRCSACGTKISFTYPLVELAVGLFALSITPALLDMNSLMNYFFNVSLFATFTAIFCIDLKHKIIPNELNLYLAVLFLCSVVVHRSYWYWLLGGTIGLLMPLSITYLFYQLKGKIGLGGGDIKLFAALGIYLGPLGIFLNMGFSCFLGSLIMLLLIASGRASRDSQIAFGPFIVLVACFQIFFPEQFLFLSSFILKTN